MQWLHLWGWLVYMTRRYHGYKICNKLHNTVRLVEEVSTTTRHHGVRMRSFHPEYWGKARVWQVPNPEYLNHNGLRTRNIWIITALQYEIGYLSSSQLYFWTWSVPKLNEETVILQLWRWVLIWITMCFSVKNFIQIIVCTIANVSNAVFYGSVAERMHVGRQ